MPMKMKNIKGIDLFCASPASTAICSSTNQRSMVRNGMIKPLQRLNSKLADITHSPSSTPRVPCISELPFTPRRPSSDYVSRRKSSADVSDLRYKYQLINNTHGHSSRYLLGDSPFLDSLALDPESTATCDSTPRKSLSLVPVRVRVQEELRKSRSETGRLGSLMDAEKEKKNKRVISLVKVNDRDQRVIKSSNVNHARGVIKNSGDGRQKSMGQCKNDSSTAMKSSSQVVVLRVSLHCKCKGCEGKLRRHLCKMEGVTSFSIDMETKKVTVIGNVTPLGVLTSISKVKNAQFWPSSASTSSATSSSSSTTSTLDFSN